MSLNHLRKSDHASSGNADRASSGNADRASQGNVDRASSENADRVLISPETLSTPPLLKTVVKCSEKF